MAHHGKILKRQIARLGLSQQAAAEKMGFVTRQALTNLYLIEELKENKIQKAINAFGLKREIFFPPDELPAAQTVSLEQLMAAHAAVVAAQTQFIDLQQQLINELKRQISELKAQAHHAPKTERGAKPRTNK